MTVTHNNNFKDTDSFREYLLSEIRTARLQTDLWRCQLDTVGIALKAGMINCEQAIRELNLKLIVEGTP